MFGILPFLIQWIALAQLGNQVYQQLYYNAHSTPPKSHWTLLNDFQQLPEEDIELFLPQICNMILDRGALTDSHLFDYFEQLLVNKCADCFPFGLRVCALLKASTGSSTEGFFKRYQLSSSSAGNTPPSGNSAGSWQGYRREEKLRQLTEHVEYATAHGSNRLSPAVRQYRREYYADCQYLLDSLARLGNELRTYPVAQRNLHLRNGLSQLNSMLCYRMLTQQPIYSALDRVSIQDTINSQYYSTTPTGSYPQLTYPTLSQGEIPFNPFDNTFNFHQQHPHFNLQQLSSCCPSAAMFSLHLPLQHATEKVCRILRFVESECEILPSKDRTPYLVVVELLEQPFVCKSDELYTEGRHIPTRDGQGVSSSNPQSPQPGATQPDKGQEQIMPTIRPTLPYPVGDPPSSSSSSSSSSVTSAESISAGLFDDDDDYDNSSTSSANVQSFARDNKYHEFRGGAGLPQGTLYEQQYPNPQFHQEPPHYRRRPSLRRPRPLSSQHPHLHHPAEEPQQFNEGYHSQQQQGEFFPPSSSNSEDVYFSNQPQQAFDSNTFSRQPSSSSSMVSSTSLYSEIPHPVGIVRPKTWNEKRMLLQSISPFGHLPGYTIRSFIVKSGDDLRKEMLAMQLLRYMKQIFETEGLDIYLRPYDILSTGYNSGWVEYIDGAISIDRMKKLYKDQQPGAARQYLNRDKRSQASMTLSEYFQLSYGPTYSVLYNQAVVNFVKSLVGYSLFTYLIQVKDRHNANLMIDSEGHIIHIDFGFILGDSPGFNMNFESAPFKLTKEYIDLLGGIDSPLFHMFEDLFLRGFLALQKHLEGLSAIVQLFYNDVSSNTGADNSGSRRKGVVDALRSRLLFPQSHEDILALIGESMDNWRTRQYDWFQQRSNNIQM